MSVRSKLSLGSVKRRLSDREYNMELLSSNLSKLEKDLSEVFVNVKLLMKSPDNIERMHKEIVSVDEIFLEIQYYFEKYIALFEKTPDEETFWLNKIDERVFHFKNKTRRWLRSDEEIESLGS